MWKPSLWARLFAGAHPWRVTLSGGQVSIKGPVSLTAEVRRLGVPQVSRDGWFTTVQFPATGVPALGGLRRSAATAMVEQFSAAIQQEQRLAQLLHDAAADVEAAQAWWTALAEAASRPMWLARSVVGQLETRRPSLGGLRVAASERRLAERVRALVAPCQEAVQACQQLDLAGWARQRNTSFMAWERRESADFFQTVERSPLTNEQVEATICFEDRVQAIASAGSGKTSTMVAKAGYAICRQIAQPTEILLLAFNAAAANELGDRVTSRLGDHAAGIKASTFHALGLRVIGEATGKKPSVPAYVTDEGGRRRVFEIVDQLRDSDPSFRRDWDLFRLVFGKALAPFGDDPDPRASEFRTLAGEVVKSQEEVMIANWLFTNHVRYEYERDYEHPTTDADHRQYQPDFYYPDIGVYHEHWALGDDGRPPEHFTGYLESMQWRRQAHADHGTALIETTSATIRDGSGFEHLAAELRRHGIQLEEDPNREAVYEPPISDEDLVWLVRQFMVHAKGNRHSRAQLEQRAGRELRSRLFLRLYERVVHQWDTGLRRANAVDFEDMLNLATDLIGQGRWTSPYHLVMVDELQDTSVSRAALVQALLSTPGTYLYAVGDDWQSINRFAGSDLSVMTDFGQRFGAGDTVRLTRTFRCSQQICDVAGEFVTKNPAQIRKTVRSSAPSVTPPVCAISVKDRAGYDDAISAYLHQLDTALDGPADVLILGRYRKSRDDAQAALTEGVFRHLSVKFSTIHAAKGAEADYVLIPGMESRGGFPSTKEDDPLLQLAMAEQDPFPFAEERRLFYVALTRARRSVALFTRAGVESPFLLELVRSTGLRIQNLTGGDATPIFCPKCDKPMKRRNGRYGPFYGCTGYPACNGTLNIDQNE